MLRFLRHLALFLLCFAALAIATDHLISTGLRRVKTGEFGTWHDIYEGSIDSDLVVIGSSRAMVHISPSVLEDSLDMSVYNLGHNGQHFPMQAARFYEYLDHNRHPECVVLAVDITSLHDRETVFQYEQFLPYFGHDRVIKAVSGYKGYDLVDAWLPMYRYRGRGELVTQGVRMALGLEESTYDRQRGYIGRDFEWDGTFDEFAKTNSQGYRVPVDSDVENAVHQLARSLAENGIMLIMVFTPEYKPAQQLCLNRQDVISRLRNISEKSEAVFLDYSDDPICQDKSLFYNSQHLNRRGAERFSSVLGKQLAATRLMTP